tara:strand:+ start:254 stop:487 length:234 start_codon:yes stop_codon:yes gene_type:complete
MEFTVKLEGIKLFKYLKERFGYSNSKAILTMVENDQDISFLDNSSFSVEDAYDENKYYEMMGEYCDHPNRKGEFEDS